MAYNQPWNSILAAFTVGLFPWKPSATVLLAAYMPIVAGMGGNVLLKPWRACKRNCFKTDIP